jgi:hypothetical protein
VLDIPWEMAIESEQSRSIEASLSADLAVHAMLVSAIPPQFEEIRHGGLCRPLPRKKHQPLCGRGRPQPGGRCAGRSRPAGLSG